MINKQIRVGGGTRSTPIDLKTIDSEVALLSGRATQTPIGMKELWDEVQSLKTEINKSGYKKIFLGDGYNFPNPYTVPEEYETWDFFVYKTQDGILGTTVGKNNGSASGEGVTWTKNGRQVKWSGNRWKSITLVLLKP